MSSAIKFGPKVKTIIVIMMLGVLAAQLIGCEMGSKTISRNEVNQCIDDINKKNKTAIDKRDTELAREVWSEVTEYSVLAKEHGDDELSEALTTAASTYVHLVNYCSSGDQKSLEKFEQQFNTATTELIALVEENNVIK